MLNPLNVEFFCLIADLASERSPTSVAHFSQHHLLPLLYERAQRLGQDVHNLQQSASRTAHPGPLLMGHECTSIMSKSDGAIVKISASQVISLGYEV